MTHYNPKTNKIEVSPDSTEELLHRATGAFFLNTLKKLATYEGDGKPISAGVLGIREDWKIIKKWVGATSDELNEEQIEKWGITYVSYLAEGKSPSVSLEESFQESLKTAQLKKWTVIPLTDEIRGVLNRMLAAPANPPKPSAPRRVIPQESVEASDFSIWWRTRPASVRKWLFGSGVWAVATFLVISIFDPFDWNGHWYEEEVNQIFMIVSLPFWAWGVKSIYDRYVK